MIVEGLMMIVMVCTCRRGKYSNNPLLLSNVHARYTFLGPDCSEFSISFYIRCYSGVGSRIVVQMTNLFLVPIYDGCDM
jgi:hypothetical protein